jgi:branched-chain amino acid transport system substrate-binding protein
MQRILKFVLVLVCIPGRVCFADAPEPHRIGVVYGLSGPAQTWSEYGRMGLELARDELNSSGGVRGAPIELVFEDSRTRPADGVSA